MHLRTSTTNGPLSTGITNQVTPLGASIATVADISPGAGTSEPPVPPPVPEAEGSSPGPVNQALASSLTRAENICRAALKAGRIELLSANGSDVTADFVNGVLAQISSTRKLLGIAEQQTNAKQDKTEEGLTLEEQLIQCIQTVQARARQKYGANSGALKGFHIGDRLPGNRAVLEQVSQNLLTRLESETLPGLSAEAIAKLQSVREDYVKSELEQTSTGGDAATARLQAKSRIDAIVAKRQKIQFAAESVWPWHDDANLGVRKEFELPATRPYAA